MKPSLLKVLPFYVLFLFSIWAPSARSQTVTFDSVKIAESLINANWANLEPVFPALFSTLEKDIKSSGGTDTASKVYIVEIQKAMNREGVSRAYAQLVATNLNAQEQRDVLMFLNSSAGQKYLDLSSKARTGDFVLPMIKQACEATNPQLGFFDRGSLNKICRGF